MKFRQYWPMARTYQLRPITDPTTRTLILSAAQKLDEAHGFISVWNRSFGREFRDAARELREALDVGQGEDR